ncbi:MAG: rhomboid family intramembrane serine protease [Flavobacteriaceae bacterium]|nr:rhomboid family intramembrane serine protease [Flavobacteriaceae bacterium]
MIVVFFIVPLFFNVFLFLFNSSFSGWLSLFELSANLDAVLTKPWTLITYGFFHGSLGHLFWNMLLLYISGGLMLNLFQEKLFLNTFFIGILAGGLMYLLSYNSLPAFRQQSSMLIGSSAGVMAVLVFMASYMPNSPVRVFVFSVPLKYIALLFIFLDVVQIPTSNAGGHIAHLGGALWGYLYQREFLKGNDIGGWFMRTVDWVKQSLKRTKTPKRKAKPKQTRKTASSTNQKKVDEILDKIAASGYESLTKEEKAYLFRSSKE